MGQKMSLTEATKESTPASEVSAPTPSAEVRVSSPTTSIVALSGLQQNQGSTTETSGSDKKPKKKICCACPETKKLRDECIVQHGEEGCTKLIEAHRTCLRAEGFNI